VADDVIVDVGNPDDIVTARQAGHQLARKLGFSLTDVTMIATAISEVARNITSYAGYGAIRLGCKTEKAGRHWWCVPKTTVRVSPTSKGRWRTAFRPGEAWDSACPVHAG
jgi:hypothetical protein